MRKFIYSLMTDKLNGAFYSCLKFLLYIISLCYALAIFIRALLYKFRIFRTQTVPMKVISVGNLTLGGTGKTPFVICLANMIEGTLKKSVSILIRGYGWDEQAMLKKKLPDVPILAGENRAKSAHRAIKLYGSNTAILDDGFQHWEMKRDLDIVLIDSRSPFGNGQLFPRGILREPVSAIARADVVVFTKINSRALDIGSLKSGLTKLNEKLIFLEAVHKPKNFYDVKMRKDLDLSFVNGKRAILLSSIGDPSYFEDTIKGLGANIVEHIAFGDHHDYSPSDARFVMKRASERTFDFIVTTDKDAVKLSRMSISFAKYQLLVLVVDMEITSGKEELIARLHSLYTG